MKALLLFLFLPFTLMAQQPTITFSVTGGKGEVVRVMRPMNGKYFAAAWTEDTLNAAGELVIHNRDLVPGMYEFVYNRLYRLYVRPGETYAVTVGKDAPLKIKARDEEGQLALNGLNFKFYQSVAMEYAAADSLFANNKKTILTKMEEQLNPFRKLQEQQKITNGFYQCTEKLVKIYYATVLAATQLHPIWKTVFKKDSSAYNEAKVLAIGNNWKEALAVADMFDTTNMAVSTYTDYSNLHTGIYLNYYLQQVNGTLTIAQQQDDYWKKRYDMIAPNFREPLKEWLLADKIYNITMEDSFQPFILDWYRDYTSNYPKSIYTPLLAPGVKKVQAFQDKIKNGFSANHHFVEQPDSINSIEQLAALFKGKTVYVDLWATWCVPCKAEFSYLKDLKAFLKGKNVQTLYISLDKPTVEKQWKDMIKYYDLQGYNMRASTRLLADLRNAWGVNQGLSIPRYAIIKDGKVVLNNAKRPSDKEALYKQIAGYL